MRLKKLMTGGLLGSLALVVVTLGSMPASAQAVLFDWGSNETVNDSGREVVKFNSKARVGELIVSFGDRRLYYITAPGQALSYPIAIPREKSKWEGVTSVSQKRVNPSWTPTPDMIAENPRLPPWVPGGHPMNPMGTHALYLGSSSYRIHGTDAPWTIGTVASKGCVRMYNKDVQDLYPRIPVGTRVTVTYQTFKSLPMDGDSAKAILTSLDKGRKPVPSEDVAEAAAKNAKMWKEGGSIGQTGKNRSYTSGADAEAEKAALTETVANRDSDTKEKDTSDKEASEEKASSSKAVDATVDYDDADERKKRRREMIAGETGSVEKDDKKLGSANKGSSTEGSDEKGSSGLSNESSSGSGSVSETKPKTASREKAERNTDAAVKKTSSDDDPAQVAKRAMAAAERAAAAAERAADAAERASAAVAKVTALAADSKSEASSSGAAPAGPAEEPKATPAAPLGEWPVVRQNQN